MQTSVEEFDVTARQLETDSSIAREHVVGLLEAPGCTGGPGLLAQRPDPGGSSSVDPA